MLHTLGEPWSRCPRRMGATPTMTALTEGHAHSGFLDPLHHSDRFTRDPTNSMISSAERTLCALRAVRQSAVRHGSALRARSAGI
jgi:hypothetical protein